MGPDDGIGEHLFEHSAAELDVILHDAVAIALNHRMAAVGTETEQHRRTVGEPFDGDGVDERDGRPDLQRQPRRKASRLMLAHDTGNGLEIHVDRFQLAKLATERHDGKAAVESPKTCIPACSAAIQNPHASVGCRRDVEGIECERLRPAPPMRRTAAMQIKHQQTARLDGAYDQVMLPRHRQTAETKVRESRRLGNRREIARPAVIIAANRPKLVHTPVSTGRLRIRRQHADTPRIGSDREDIVVPVTAGASPVPGVQQTLALAAPEVQHPGQETQTGTLAIPPESVDTAQLQQRLPVVGPRQEMKACAVDVHDWRLLSNFPESPATGAWGSRLRPD